MARGRPLLDEVAGRKGKRGSPLRAAPAWRDDKIGAALRRVEGYLDLCRRGETVDEREESTVRKLAGVGDRDQKVADADVSGKRVRGVVVDLDQAQRGIQRGRIFNDSWS